MQELVEAFLRSIYSPAIGNPDYADAVVSLWSMPSKLSIHLPLRDLAAIAYHATELDSRGADVYYGVSLRKPGLPENRRGTKEDLLGVTALWMDVDIAGPAHAAKNLPADKNEAADLLADLGIPPDSIIDSGNGLHVYWLLGDVVPLRTTDEVSRFERTLLSLQQRTKMLAAKRGWHLDILADATRVLRLPETHNRKTGVAA